MASSLRSGFKRFAAASGLTLASVVLSLLVLEISVRLADGVPVLSTDNFVARALDGVRSVVVQYDPHLGWTSKPNVQRKGRYTTGQYGARMSGPTITPLRQNAILVVGDSFAAGTGVVDGDAWPARLERLLGEQVIDAAVGGYGLDQIVLRGEILMPLLHPRLLLVQSRLEFGTSIDRMSVAGGAPKPYFKVKDGKLTLHNDPFLNWPPGQQK